jgi:hypothetical protein
MVEEVWMAEKGEVDLEALVEVVQKDGGTTVTTRLTPIWHD